MIKWLLILMFFASVMLPCHAIAQNVVVDTLQVKNYRIKSKAGTAKSNSTKSATPEVSKKKDKSFMGLMGSLGQGLLNKFKRRFNLEEIKDKVELTKHGIKETLKSKNKNVPEEKPKPSGTEKGN